MVEKRILLVEDEETVVIPFQLILESEEYQVDTATTGRQAIEKLGENEYRVVILDMKLPDMRGIDVAREIRSRTESSSIIIVTGYPDLVESLEALDIGIEEILLKPIDAEELLRTVEEAFVSDASIVEAKPR